MKLRQGIAITTTEYGGVLLDERDGTYWQLNECGTIVVNALAAGRDTDAAVEQLLEEFDVERAEAEADVAELTRQLIEAKIVTP
ncbi:lasso peptide biosynthesis PqqD family chaperone [Streptomyces sp. NBC_01142]|uniref:lasso peptide biosynthesis PqqD family chaperone n=1 Tax=Streptomyces sp. NBC_01142 TaxID=2975865 RepID=UPI00224E17E2|nr:lasso peptide biosynthesis PqqD family chaperone [Streptomyces sp. NBC_01142]MCX4818403.1 lasso peptide biosynthesis PqqD family chaperone [Streptomyces sp. NBC_01142]